jgi:hypothetical protein
VGDWVGVLNRDVDFYVVVTKTKLQWGIFRLAFDFEGATTEMKRLYPNMSSIQTQSAWRDR